MALDLEIQKKVEDKKVRRPREDLNHRSRKESMDY
jgi:hypothetical protein